MTHVISFMTIGSGPTLFGKFPNFPSSLVITYHPPPGVAQVVRQLRRYVELMDNTRCLGLGGALGEGCWRNGINGDTTC